MICFLVEMVGICLGAARAYRLATHVAPPTQQSTRLLCLTACSIPFKTQYKIKKQTTSKSSDLLFGGDGGDRTHDLLNAIQALSQLSYAPKDKIHITIMYMILQELFFQNFSSFLVIG